MASLTTYLLVSHIDDPDEVKRHPVVAERAFDIHTPPDPEAEIGSIAFVHRSALEDAEDLGPAARELSTAFPSAIVQLCVFEERFDQLERGRAVLYKDGTHAGEIEHGYIFNIGGGER
jgi:hypothetical protein